MRALIVIWWSAIRESYWFVPSLMAIGAIALSFGTTAIDTTIGSQWLQDVDWLYANKPAGARAVLSTVAGSMITVAGVTFSMTILSISYTTGQVGPRLLNNFMRDTSNQVTLGVFISTFLYCLMVLRTVRNADPVASGSGVPAGLTTAFVPHVAMIVGLLLAITSVGVLIYYIHHIPESIHISNIVAGVGHDLNHRIEQQFPSLVGDPHDEESQRDIDADLPTSFYESAVKLSSSCSGYIEYVDTSGLMAVACKNDLVLRLRYRAGDFVTPTSTLLLAAPKDRVGEDVAAQLTAAFVSGAQRTPKQNLRFVMNQLVEVAMRALSPGVNDPFTAMNCMDWLQSALENLAGRQLPDAHRFDDDGNLRVVAEPESFSSLVSLACDQLRPYVAVDGNASIHMMEMLCRVAVTVSCESRLRILVRQAGALRRECRRRLNDKRCMKQLTERYRSMIRLLKEPDFRKHVMETGDWIGGRA